MQGRSLSRPIAMNAWPLLLVLLLLLHTVATCGQPAVHEHTESDEPCGQERIAARTMFGPLCVSLHALTPLAYAGPDAWANVMRSDDTLDTYMYVYRLLEMVGAVAPHQSLYPIEKETAWNIARFVTYMMLAVVLLLLGFYAFCAFLIILFLRGIARALRIHEEHSAAAMNVIADALVLLVAAALLLGVAALCF